MSLFTKLFGKKVQAEEQTEEVASTRRAWLPEEVKFLTKNFRKIGAAETAWQLERTEDSVRGKAKALGL